MGIPGTIGLILKIDIRIWIQTICRDIELSTEIRKVSTVLILYPEDEKIRLICTPVSVRIIPIYIFYIDLFFGYIKDMFSCSIGI